MTQQSKYPDNQVSAILQDLAMVLEKHQAPLDLSLITLGNLATNLLQSNVGKEQQQVLAQAFAKALIQSVKS